MAIPKFEAILCPILARAAKQNISRRDCRDFSSEYLALSLEERAETIPSGASTVVANRSGWAITFLNNAALVEKVAPKTYAVTEAGRVFLDAHPKEISHADLKVLPGWFEAWQTTKAVKESSKVNDPVEGVTPLEAIDNAIEQIKADVQARLPDAVFNQTPEFFERLVLDVLVEMGYGGDRVGADRHMGRVGDEEIDGRINQDTLGLDQILAEPPSIHFIKRTCGFTATNTEPPTVPTARTDELPTQTECRVMALRERNLKL